MLRSMYASAYFFCFFCFFFWWVGWNGGGDRFKSQLLFFFSFFQWSPLKYWKYSVDGFVIWRTRHLSTDTTWARFSNGSLLSCVGIHIKKSPCSESESYQSLDFISWRNTAHFSHRLWNDKSCSTDGRNLQIALIPCAQPTGRSQCSTVKLQCSKVTALSEDLKTSLCHDETMLQRGNSSHMSEPVIRLNRCYSKDASGHFSLNVLKAIHTETQCF